MTTPMPADQLVDATQDLLAAYADAMRFDDLPDQVVHVAKVRLIDTMGALLGGYSGKPCAIARRLSVPLPPGSAGGATILGSNVVTSPEMAAFANGTAARFLEYNDVYHYPGSAHGHPSDVIAPILAAAESAGRTGRDLLAGIVLGYEVYGHVSDKFANRTFDNSNCCCVAAAVGAGHMLGLRGEALKSCIAMAVLPNNVLRQVRRDRFSMWKEVASGYAGRAAVFAALMAREGMESPVLPFEGAAGWCEHVVGSRFAFERLGSDWKILHTRTRHRPAMGEMHAAIFAAETLGPLADPAQVEAVTVEVYRRARDLVGTGPHFWAAENRATADHSIPYVVAAALLDGELTPVSYEDARLWSAELRALLPKIEVVENPAFTAAYDAVPRQQRARVTLHLAGGETRAAESGGDGQDLAAEKSDAEIEAKFRSLAEPLLGPARAGVLLDLLWRIDSLDDLSQVAGLSVIE